MDTAEKRYAESETLLEGKEEEDRYRARLNVWHFVQGLFTLSTAGFLTV